MKHKKLTLWAAAAGLLALLTGCNIFNPGGAGDLGSCGSQDADCHIALGQNLIRKGRFEASMAAYEKAIAIDSTRSLAYYGYGKAAIYFFALNTSTILGDLKRAGEDKDMEAFINHPDPVLNLRYAVSVKVIRMLDILAERDTLSTVFLYVADSSRNADKADFARRKAFITHYLDTVSSPSRASAKFPLTDGKMDFNDLALEFTAFKMMFKFLDFFDLEPKGIFNETDRKMRGILQADGGFDIENITEQMKDDTVFQAEMNNKIVELQNGMGDVNQLLAQLGLTTGGSDTSNVEAQSSSSMDSIVAGLGGALVFYQFGDRLDNDADGCIDEEIADSLDNDLDGFVDEDSRVFGDSVVSANNRPDSLDNDRNGLRDDALENKVGGLFPTNPRRYILTFVAQYLNDNNELNTPEGQTTWVKIKKGASNMDVRIAIQADSLAVRLTPGQPVPAQYQTQLQNAKNLIGGCWRKY